jgi:hypothetical protein
MRILFSILLTTSLFIATNTVAAPLTERIPQISNDNVNVWEAIIYPGKNQALKMHRHDYNRVIYAFTNGLLKITNDKGQIHFLKLQLGKSYYLPKDLPRELHTDENVTTHPIKVLVIELKKD